MGTGASTAENLEWTAREVIVDRFPYPFPSVRFRSFVEVRFRE